ncbi:hypothetical protein [Methylobrevis pamukkalensis]|nr:hypothetical protein [Methylobrevis pamukkalensis]
MTGGSMKPNSTRHLEILRQVLYHRPALPASSAPGFGTVRVWWNW